MSENTIRLGYVGLGNIGGPMATSLAKWEGGMTVFDLSDDAVAKLVDAGAAKADSLADLAANADIIGICVLNDAQVRTVVSGEGGLLSTAAPGTIIAIHSTIGPQTAIDLAAEASEKGVTVLDAPISGGAIAAQSGAKSSAMACDDMKASLKAQMPLGSGFWSGLSGGGAEVQRGDEG